MYLYLKNHFIPDSQKNCFMAFQILSDYTYFIHDPFLVQKAGLVKTIGSKV